MTSRSGHLPRLSAAKIPSEMPTTSQRTNAPIASQNVTGAARVISANTWVCLSYE